MVTYRIKLSWGNCCAEREYDVERGVPHSDADLICPNCGCSPTANDYLIFSKKKLYGKSRQVEDVGENNA